MGVDETIKGYIKQNEKAKLALIKILTESQSLDAQTLQDCARSRYYKNASYAHNLIYWAFDSVQKEGIVELRENKPRLTDSSGISDFLSSESEKVSKILSFEWGSGDFKLMGDFDVALHILARLIASGVKVAFSDINARLEEDLCNSLGAFKNLSSSQMSYRRRVVVPRTIKMLEELGIVERSGPDGSLAMQLDKLQILLPQYSQEIFGVVHEITAAQTDKIEKSIKLSNEANITISKLKEENTLLREKSKGMEQELKAKENAIGQFKVISSFIERTKAIDIDANWVITCTAINLIEASVKKKLVDMSVSREKVLNKKFDENYELLRKLLLEKEHRSLASRLLFNDIYKKVRGKIDHEGHVYKPSSRECTYIVEETVDFIDELFTVK